jgi:hypothetical protein
MAAQQSAPREFPEDDIPPPLVEVSDDADDSMMTRPQLSSMFVAFGRGDDAAENTNAITAPSSTVCFYV